jgi:Putative Ig domain
MMKSRSKFRFPLLALLALPLAAGCGGGGITAVGITPTLNTIYVPGQAIVLDGGQSLGITAAVVNDATRAGGAITLTGPGTLSQPTPTTVSSSTQYSLTYTAPSNATAGATATITITSNAYTSQTASIAITLNPALAIATPTLPNGTAGVAYTATLAGTGGTPAYKWTLASGTLPVGLTLGSANGVLSGTPNVAGTYNFTIALSDVSTLTATVTQAYTVNISPTVSTTSLPNGIAGTAYNQQLTYSGGSGGVFTITSGSLPTGLTLSPSGAITGTPALATAGNSYKFSVTVTIGSASSAILSLTITIDALPIVTTTALPSGNIGIPYSQQLNYTGGSGVAPTWAITAGSLPAGSGLTLNPTTGVISGTPTAATTYNFSVAVTVGTQTSAAQPLTLVINSLVITSGNSASAEVALPFSFQLTAAGGTGPYTWSLAATSNPLPAGLSLNPTTGFITGSPTTNTGSPFTGIVVEATDHLGATATQAMTFNINAARSTVNNSMLNGQYAFLLTGFDATGHPLAMAGDFTADGNGNITSGLLDINGTGSAPSLSNTLTATTYSVGPDNRGKLTLTYGASTITFVFALNSVNGGDMTEFDATGQSLTGPLALQTPTAFTTASITGGYAFGLDGFATGNSAGALTRRAAIGEVQFNGTGGGSSELLSTAIGATPQPSSSSTIAIAPNGRGTISFTIPNGLPNVNLVAYVVSPSRMFLISSSTASTGGTHDLLSGQILQQTIANGSFNATALNATSVVRTERLTLNAANALVPDVQLGLITFTGTSRLTLTSDEDNGGVITSDSLGGSYTVAANGRVSFTLSAGLGGCADCVSTQSYMYLIGANQGFLMDFSTSPNFGYFVPQTATGIGLASLQGNYSAGTLSPLAQSATYLSEAFNSTGTGTLSGTADENTAGTLSPDAPFTAAYTVNSSGRAAIATTGNGQVLYIISPTQALLLDLTATSPVVREVTHQ